MTANELKECIQRETAQTSIVPLTFELFSATNGLSEYNRIIRNQIPNEMGIYLWENADTGEIIYIGMAGKMKANGEFVNHTVRARLLASRGKDPNTGRDIQTNAYLKSIIESDAIIQLNIHTIHLNPNQLPGYAEAVLVNAFYQRNGRLPRYNAAF